VPWDSIGASRRLDSSSIMDLKLAGSASRSSPAPPRGVLDARTRGTAPSAFRYAHHSTRNTGRERLNADRGSSYAWGTRRVRLPLLHLRRHRHGAIYVVTGSLLRPIRLPFDALMQTLQSQKISVINQWPDPSWPTYFDSQELQRLARLSQQSTQSRLGTSCPHRRCSARPIDCMCAIASISVSAAGPTRPDRDRR